MGLLVVVVVGIVGLVFGDCETLLAGSEESVLGLEVGGCVTLLAGCEELKTDVVIGPSSKTNSFALLFKHSKLRYFFIQFINIIFKVKKKLKKDFGGFCA